MWAAKDLLFATGFTPFTETNIARTNQAVPVGTAGCWVTLIGGGGGGGWQNGSSAGGGGGGGGRVDRVFVPKASLGTTYTVVIGTGGAGGTNSVNDGIAGGASTFASASVSLSAGGGHSTSGGSSGGAGGTSSASGVTATTYPGTAGGSGGSISNGSPGTSDAIHGVGCGGGGGDDGSTAGSAGGSSQTVTGGAGGTSGSPNGGAPASAGSGYGGAGGGGAYDSSSGHAGNGGLYGGGGGGNSTSGTAAGVGAGGNTILEWMNVPPPTCYVRDANCAATTSVILPAHAIGDIIVLFVYRSNSTTTATKPTASGTVPAWVDIDNNTGANTNCARTAYFVATATTTTTGTWTNATGIAAVVITGQFSTPIGGHAESGSTGTSVTAPAITPTNTDGTSIVLDFYGASSVTAWAAPPSGYTRCTSVPTSVCCNSDDNTSSVGTPVQTCTAGVDNRAAQIEIRAH